MAGEASDARLGLFLVPCANVQNKIIQPFDEGLVALGSTGYIPSQTFPTKLEMSVAQY